MAGFMKRPSGSARPDSENPPISDQNNRVKVAVSLLDQLAPNMLFISQGVIRVHIKSPRVPKIIVLGTYVKSSAFSTKRDIYQRVDSGLVLNHLQVHPTRA